MYYQDIVNIIKNQNKLLTSREIICELRKNHEQVNEIRVRAVLKKIKCKEIVRSPCVESRGYSYLYVGKIIE